MRLPKTFRVSRGGEEIATIQEHSAGWFWYGGGCNSLASTPPCALLQMTQIPDRIYLYPILLETQPTERQTRTQIEYVRAAERDELVEALRDLLAVSENADETGYVDGEGWLPLERIQAKARAVLAKHTGAAGRLGVPEAWQASEAFKSLQPKV